ALDNHIYDPCDNYTSLNQSWRGTNETGGSICDSNFNWTGWYRLTYKGMSIRMPESCVNMNRCGTYYTLWLNGPHPQIQDGIVTCVVCGSSGTDCCYYTSYPIRIKACPGDYYVYEFVKPSVCNSAYCAGKNTGHHFSKTLFFYYDTSQFRSQYHSDLKTAKGIFTSKCGEDLFNQLENITAQVLPPQVVTKYLDMVLTTQEQLLKVEAASPDKLASIGNTVLNRTEKLVSTLVKPTETTDSVNISLNGLDLQVFAVGKKASLNEIPQLRINSTQMEIDLIQISKNNNGAVMSFVCCASGSAAAAFMSFASMATMLKPSFFNTSNNAVNTMMSMVVSATLPKTTNTNLTTPVNFTLEHIAEFDPNGTLSCVYWNNTEWIVDGCDLLQSNSSHSVCSCVHLSTFALIMQVNPPPPGYDSDPLLDVLSIVAVGVGLFFLSLSLLTFALCRRNMKVNVVPRINLCISLFLAHLLFILTQEFLQYIRADQLMCAALAGVLHFLFLSAFVWMFIEAVLLLISVKNLTKIRSMQRNVLGWKCLIVIGYVIPLVVVGVSVGLFPGGYGSEQCWIKTDRNFVWSFLGPVCFIITVSSEISLLHCVHLNFIFFIVIIITLKNTMAKLNSESSQIKRLSMLVYSNSIVILGCPWILGFFTQGSKVLEIVFLFLNSQQGTFIFLVHCVFNQEVRQQYKKWLYAVCQCFERPVDMTERTLSSRMRNRSTDDAISSVVHTALTHLEQKDSYVRMLFVDFTSAFNTMIPQTLTDKLSSLGLRSSLCNWVLDFLTNRPQSVRIHNLSSSTTILSTGSPQGCVLSPLLFTLLTYDCSPIHPGCHIVKFADDTAVVGCITNSDESGYRQEVEHLEGWCRKNNLCINVKKTKEMIVDFRRGRHAHLPLHVGGSAVEVVSSYRYLGVHLSNNLTWSNNTSSLVRKAHQRLYFLRRLRRAGLGSPVLTSFYRCVVESVLCSSINVWHGSCSAADRKALQRVVKAAQRSVGVSLPTTTDIYTSRCRKRATCIMKDPTHPAHSLFVPLPSGRRLRSIKCKTNRLRNSFIPEACEQEGAQHKSLVKGNRIKYHAVHPEMVPVVTVVLLITIKYSSPEVLKINACNNYTILDQPWRAATVGTLWICDSLFNWKGWYRLLYNGMDIRMAEACPNKMMCGTDITLWLSGAHPQISDGIVTRQICGNDKGSCCQMSMSIHVQVCPGNYSIYAFVKPAYCTAAYCAGPHPLIIDGIVTREIWGINAQNIFYKSNPIQVKACPGNYYVYRLIKPAVSVPMPTYCSVAFDTPSFDPCINYTSLDQPWRATNGRGGSFCDSDFTWTGWYRLLYNGMNIHMPESCVNESRCGTNITLRLYGSHPQIEDGIVTRGVCGKSGDECCYYRSPAIRVKACPGNYHVYEFVKPTICGAYCADITTITATETPDPNITIFAECKANFTLECGEDLFNQLENMTTQVFSPQVVTKYLDMVLNAQEQLLKVDTISPDKLVSIGNTVLNRTEKLVSTLVKPTETTDSVHISLNGLVGIIYFSEVFCCRTLGSAATALMSFANIASMLKPSFFNETSNTEKTMMSTVVSATLPKTTNTQLSTPVNFTLEHISELDPNGTLSCVYWNNTEWIVDGCELLQTNISHTVCSCVHLSTFALIMQIDPPLTGYNSESLMERLSMVAVGVGLLSLSLSLLTFALCHRNLRVNITPLINLCISLFLAHLLFILTQEFLQYIRADQLACAVLAGVLHFLFLSAFVWMFIEAVLLLISVKNLTKIKSKQKDVLGWKCLIVIGYVTPMVVVGVSVGLFPYGYGSEHCWIRTDRSFVWSFLGPVCFIIIFNLIFFIIIIVILRKTMAKLNSESSQLKQMKILVFKTLIQIVILGCPWILGFFTHGRKVLEILFLFLNSQQGTFIFLVHCVLNQEVSHYEPVGYSDYKAKVTGELLGVVLEDLGPESVQPLADDDMTMTKEAEEPTAEAIKELDVVHEEDKEGTQKEESLLKNPVSTSDEQENVREMLLKFLLEAAPSPSVQPLGQNETVMMVVGDVIHSLLDTDETKKQEDPESYFNNMSEVVSELLDFMMEEGASASVQEEPGKEGRQTRRGKKTKWRKVDWPVGEVSTVWRRGQRQRRHHREHDRVDFTPSQTVGKVDGGRWRATFEDPCNNYTPLDQPWRATNATGLWVCDRYLDWTGWYRLLYNGMSIRMPESCVNESRCGTYITLWLNGPHPQIQDAVVYRGVCGKAGSDCCYYSSTPVRVKACPGDYYVYEFVKPISCDAAYCADVNSITPNTVTSVPASQLNTTDTMNHMPFDPCNVYSVLDDDWRRTDAMSYSSYDDTLVEWSGWYRLYLQGKSAQIPESDRCWSFVTCGGYTALLLGGPHPLPRDGIVTRDINGTYADSLHSRQCNAYRSDPIQVKACPGNYYVYRLVKPTASLPMPTYCAAATFEDPCNNYTPLDQPWRATNATGLWVCDRYFNWTGWYRLLYNGMNIRMPESCVDRSRCGTNVALWLNGSHPQIVDGIVTRGVCGRSGSDCCHYSSTPVRVKACPGDYYVYEFVKPISCDAAYCADVNSITPNTPPMTAASVPASPLHPNTMNHMPFDPCEVYSVLDDDWRTTDAMSYSSYDDTLVEWSGWYRLYLQGKSAQLPESDRCWSFVTCGGYTALLLGGPHPLPRDGVVTRDINGTYADSLHSRQCNSYRSNPIQVKACPGNYYVYRLVKPAASLPMPTYCAGTVVPTAAGEGIIILQFHIQQEFIPAYSNSSSDEYITLVNKITAELERLYKQLFPLTFLRCYVTRLWNGSVGVDSQLIFTNETVLPNLTAVTDSLQSAVNYSTVSLNINPSSISAGE
ncbi:hypothetical protein NFI96_028426, partial [Prochilodus magdalenae]